MNGVATRSERIAVAWRDVLVAIVFLVSAAHAEEGPIILRDVSQETGITFRHTIRELTADDVMGNRMLTYWLMKP